jgi:Zn-dependent protease with chaperone function
MRKCLWLLCAFLWCPVHAEDHLEDITQVLQRSQQWRLQQRPAPDQNSAASARVRSSFERLKQLDPQGADVQLQIIGGPLFAEALFGQRTLVVSEAAGDLPEGERLLMLAHEMGHLMLGHWGGLSALYRSHIPGAVRPETTDPVARKLSLEAQALSHRQEFEADGYGFALVRKMGFGLDNAFGLLMRQGLQFDTPTHPGTRRRLAQMRVMDAQVGRVLVNPGETDAVAARLGGEAR